ncbi:MAG: hypothetical protein IPK50_13605 [Fibrobacterota bacterium]|nr:hypothetical protein [Fibrobacterota bacterium]QQS03340.1 MAG: hypothetical protein IPK50_13605 [Fibrobacterota bacterium]
MRWLLPLLLTLGSATASRAAAEFSTDLENGDSAWTFFARSKDSATGGIVSENCHSGKSCFSFDHKGGQDWAYFSGSLSRPVNVGETWIWSVWGRIDTIAGSAGPTIAGFDAAGKAISWSLAGAAFPKRPSGWTRYDAKLVVPTGCVRILPRITGWGPGRGVFDDLELTLAKPSSGLPAIHLANDSLRVVVDPLSLGMVLHDSIHHDSVVIEPVSTFSTDSISLHGSDSAIIHCLYIPGEWAIDVGLRLRGGVLGITLHADSSSPLAANLLFPGQVRTRKGQRLAMPRGTGITLPVDHPSYSWNHHFANFWDWQVSMGLAAATDGKTGFVISYDQPSDAGVAWISTEGLRRPESFQAPSKRIWMHDRSLLVAPLRGGGWKELTARHRSRQRELGRVRSWSEKIQQNPNVAKLRGAVDFWATGSWPKLDHRFFDTLRLYGVGNALVHWGTTNGAQIDSLNARGFLTSVYTQVSGAIAGGSSMLDREYPAGIALDSAGRMIAGFEGLDATGKVLYSMSRISLRRQLEILKTTVGPDLAAKPRNTRFIDVTMAENVHDDYNPTFGSSRHENLLLRTAMFEFLKDAHRLVTGSEQSRDVSHAVVDYGEGPMSIANNKNAGQDWTTPEAVEPKADALSFDPSRRVPLLLLSSHDSFAPTWYSGDGQSKVPARWDAKDAWNILYGTMALVAPNGRAMWDSLRSRYLRTILLVGAAHDRYGFEPMTDFIPLSDDWRLQKTVYGNGWTVSANLDTVARIVGADTLAGNGFIASGSDGKIGRILTTGSPLNFVRLSDRWFMDPENSSMEWDGIRTIGGVSMVRTDDTTIHLAFTGSQESIDILPQELPWPTTTLRILATGASRPLGTTLDGGWVRLERANSPFFRLHGAFGPFRKDQGPKRLSTIPLRILGGKGGLELVWNQKDQAEFRIELFRLDGTLAGGRNGLGTSGENRVWIRTSPGVVVARLRAGTEIQTSPLSVVR